MEAPFNLHVIDLEDFKVFTRGTDHMLIGSSRGDSKLVIMAHCTPETAIELAAAILEVAKLMHYPKGDA
jgi:hypothetical protein